MYHLADSTAIPCKGGKKWCVSKEGIPEVTIPGKLFEPVDGTKKFAYKYVLN